MGMLDGKVGIITGAGRGIGRVEAMAMARAGCDLLLNDLGCSLEGEGNTEIVDEVVKEVQKYDIRAIPNYDSVIDYKKTKEMIDQAISEFGKIDIIINNAGIIRDRMIYNMSEDEWDEVIAVHLKGVFNMCKHAGKYFRARGKADKKFSGRILNAVSDAGLLGNLGQANYGAAKAGIASLTLIAAGELKKYATVNGIIQIARTRFTTSTPQLSHLIHKKDGEGFDIFHPANVTPLVVYLASDSAKRITGEIFRIVGDKCWVLRGWHDANCINNKGKPFTPEILAQKLKAELLRDIPKKQTMMEVFSNLVKM
ncbi:MAG: putative short-chain type dehydrogenase/reductase [Promethearchaeota archaeon]|nr:MAG: putative short-chain type dehydrogenase/reductase [Candidatus Lokiarchaeota archaeon]